RLPGGSRCARGPGGSASTRPCPRSATAVCQRDRAAHGGRAGTAPARHLRRVQRPAGDVLMLRIWPAVTAMRPGRVAELVELDAAVRVPLPLSTRVGFIGVAGGTGCSTVAGLAAAVLVARRSRRMLAVNASRRARSLLWHAGLTGAASVGGQHTGVPAGARHAADVTADLVTTPGGLYCMDLVGEPGTDVDDRWWQTVAPVGRFFDF